MDNKIYDMDFVRKCEQLIGTKVKGYVAGIMPYGIPFGTTAEYMPFINPQEKDVFIEGVSYNKEVISSGIGTVETAKDLKIIFSNPSFKGTNYNGGDDWNGEGFPPPITIDTIKNYSADPKDFEQYFKIKI